MGFVAMNLVERLFNLPVSEFSPDAVEDAIAGDFRAAWAEAMHLRIKLTETARREQFCAATIAAFEDE